MKNQEQLRRLHILFAVFFGIACACVIAVGFCLSTVLGLTALALVALLLAYAANLSIKQIEGRGRDE